MEYRKATLRDDDVLIDHYLAIWDSYGVSPDAYATNARQRVAKFISQGREKYNLDAFLAVQGDQIVGSCAYQLMISPYPEVLNRERRLRGYIWSVYVEPAFRGKSVATELTNLAVGKLKDMKCTDIILHASTAAEKMYAGLGFTLAKEMRMKLVSSEPSH